MSSLLRHKGASKYNTLLVQRVIRLEERVRQVEYDNMRLSQQNRQARQDIDNTLHIVKSLQDIVSTFQGKVIETLIPILKDKAVQNNTSMAR